LGYLWYISRIGQGYDQVLDIPGVSFEVFGSQKKKPGIGYSKLREDISKSEYLEWDIPKLMNDRCSQQCRISFFVLG
jgi:hypothetical protein